MRAAFLLAGIALLASAGAARAGMDYRCLASCEQAGYSRVHCMPRCAAANPAQSVNPAFPNRHGIDYRCVDKCTGTGRPRAYCLRNCAF